MKHTKVLRDYQQEAVEFVLNRPYSFLLFSMRSGKTLIACTAIKRINDRTLIICPPKVIHHWKKELEEVGVGCKVDILSSGKLSKGVHTTLIENSYKFLIVDEIHQYRGNSIRTKELIKIADTIPRKLGLTGTAFDKDYAELYYPIRILSKGEVLPKYITKFRDEYCKSDFSGYNFTLRKDKIPEFLKYFNSFTLKHYNEEIKVPPVKVVWIGPTEDQKKFIDDLLSFKPIPKINNEHASLEDANLLNKLHQVTSGFYITKDMKPIDVCTTYKFNQVYKILKRHREQKIIVWYRYKYEKELLTSRFNFLDLYVFSTKANEEFSQADKGVMLCHPKSAGTGVDISSADVSIYINFFDSFIDLVQSHYRMSKHGDKTEKIIYEILLDHPRIRRSFRERNKKQKRYKGLYGNS